MLYVGKTTRTFWQRISEHHKDWLWNVKGKIRIRLGLLEFPDGGRYSAKKLADVESLLILWHLSKENKTSTCYYGGRVDLEVLTLEGEGY